MSIKPTGILFLFYNRSMERLAGFAQPLGVLVVTNVLGAAVMLLQMLRARDRNERVFGRSALVLIVCLDVFAFLTGFSIGWMVALVTIPVGIFLGLLSRHYRYPIAIATSINFLLFLAMAGQFSFAARLYKAMPLLLLVVFAIGVIQNWQDTQKALGYGLGFLTALGYLALVTDSVASGWIGLAATVLAWTVGVVFKTYRWGYLLLGWAGFLWVLNIVIQSTFFRW